MAKNMQFVRAASTDRTISIPYRNVYFHFKKPCQGRLFRTMDDSVANDHTCQIPLAILSVIAAYNLLSIKKLL